MNYSLGDLEEEPDRSEQVVVEGTLFSVVDDEGDTLVAWRAPAYWGSVLETMSGLRMHILKRSMFDVMMLGRSMMHDLTLLADGGIDIEQPASADVVVKTTLQTEGDGSFILPITASTSITMWHLEANNTKTNIT